MAAKKRGILLMNLGSPDSTETKDVRRYLNEFLMDERVIDKSYLFRLLLVKGIITPLRAPKSAEAYKTIWTKEGSPLVVITEQVQQALSAKIKEPVAIAMRYGNPTPTVGFDSLLEQEPGLEEVIAVPLYPHYAMSSYETAVEHAKVTHKENGYKFSLSFVEPYFDDEEYINALAEVMRPFVEQPFDHLLFSYHGVPGRHIRNSDPTGQHCMKVDNCCSVDSVAHKTCYRHQVIETTKLVTAALNLPDDKWSISFQSRLGNGWLQPFTDKRLQEMPAEGIKNLLVICPAFVSDCLETLEEIAERGKEDFIKAGGEHYTMIPCLNVSEPWIETLVSLTDAQLLTPEQ